MIMNKYNLVSKMGMTMMVINTYNLIGVTNISPILPNL